MTTLVNFRCPDDHLAECRRFVEHQSMTLTDLFIRATKAYIRPPEPSPEASLQPTPSLQPPLQQDPSPSLQGSGRITCGIARCIRMNFCTCPKS